MKIAVFSTHQYDRTHLESAKELAHIDAVFEYYEASLNEDTANLAAGADAVCVFVNDILNAKVLHILSQGNTSAVLLRCAGYNNVDLEAARSLGFFVANVPAYSPESVAEYAVGLIQSLNRKISTAHDRVRAGNFSLDGLLGSTLHGKTVGLVGTGKIGECFAKIMRGFGCRLIAYDPFPSESFSNYGKYTDLDSVLMESDIVSLHCPLIASTKHLINRERLALMKPGAMLINVSRGGLIDTEAVIDALRHRRLGGLAIDVYEREAPIFYLDHSTEIIDDDALMRLITFPNVIVTGHQAFLTQEALDEIASVTVSNALCFSQGIECTNSVLKSRC